jgi:hypothetical protein
MQPDKRLIFWTHVCGVYVRYDILSIREDLQHNASELIGRGEPPPCPGTNMSIQHSRQIRPASPVRSSEMLGRIIS